jgi:hypothetical protein
LPEKKKKSREEKKINTQDGGGNGRVEACIFTRGIA